MIDLSRPVKGYWDGRGFGRHFVWEYECPLCHVPVKVRCNSWRGIDKRGRGITPETGTGAIRCLCERENSND
jgi:hypothetical protein